MNDCLYKSNRSKMMSNIEQDPKEREQLKGIPEGELPTKNEQ